MTKGALAYVHANYPGAFLKDILKKPIFYLSVAGAAITGNLEADDGTINRFAANSYLQVLGPDQIEIEEVGDGVVPLRSAHLPGAKQITIKNAYHSIQVSVLYEFHKNQQVAYDFIASSSIVGT